MTRLTNWESKAALLAHLDQVSHALVVGADATAPSRFYSLHVERSPGEPFEVGIVMSFHGIEPSWFTSDDGRRLLIGHDCSVSVIDTVNTCQVKTLSLDHGVFFEFVPIPLSDRLLAWHEIGLVCLTVSGEVLWCVSADDIVVDCTVGPDETATIRLDNGQCVQVDLCDGRIVK